MQTIKKKNHPKSQTISKTKEIDFGKISNNKDNENQQIKTIIEKLIRFMVMRNPRIIKFRDGTIVNYSDIGNIQPINTERGDDTPEKYIKDI
jgi:hypothetical protein